MDFTRHLLIDGYNVIHQWPELRSELRGGGAIARDRLAEAARVLHDREGIRVTIVFDGRGQEIEVERPTGQSTFSLLYSPSGMTADEVIERLVGSSADASLSIVVTRDMAERRTIEALGAAGLSPDDLHAWIERTRGLLDRDLEMRRRDANRQWRNGPGGDIVSNSEQNERENTP